MAGSYLRGGPGWHHEGDGSAIPDFLPGANSDRIPDRWEKRHNLSLKVNQAPRDQDKDGLRNLREYREGTNPRNADTDGDGIGDKPECNGKHGQQGQQGPPPPDSQQQPPQGPPTS